MTIQIDTREKSRAISSIIKDFELSGTKFYSSKLFVGDYMSLDNPRVVIDRKQNLLELAKNVSSVPMIDKSGKIKKGTDGKPLNDLSRFTAELSRAKTNGIHIIILCEHGYGIQALEDVRNWENPRLSESPLAMSGPRLYTILNRLRIAYDFEIFFCDKNHTGSEIRRLLGGNNE